MQGIDISVVMATYNGQKHIAAQLESILEQLKECDELIISDDHSSDDTLSIINGFSDARIKIFRPPASRGPIGNFEYALSQAAGAIIVLADQDDVWLAGRLDVVRSHFLESTGQYDLLVLDSRVVDENLRVIEPSVFRYLSAGPGLVKNVYRNTYIGCHMAFKRRLLDIALPFPKRIPMHDMWLGLASELSGGRVMFRKEVSMLFRRTGMNYTRRRYAWSRRILWRINLVFALVQLALRMRFRSQHELFAGKYE